MAIRLGWQKTPAKSLVSAGAGMYIDVHEDSEYRADNSAYGLPNSGLRAFGGVNFSSSPELRELPTFGATQPFIRA